MTSIETFFTMSSGKAIYPDIDKFKQAIASLGDGFYINRIEKIFGKRTNLQNAYYFGVVVPAVREGLKEVGYETESIDEVHEFLKGKFIVLEGRKRKRLINKITGEIKYINVVKSSRKLSTIEFNAYLERIIQWSAEYLNVVIPYPNEEL
jgi:hypothetical protein